MVLVQFGQAGAVPRLAGGPNHHEFAGLRYYLKQDSQSRQSVGPECPEAELAVFVALPVSFPSYLDVGE